MKNRILFAFFAFFVLLQVQAQAIFRPGVKGGVNFSHFTQTDNSNEKFSAKQDFYVGIFGALRATKVYTLQPELTYTRQGAKREYIDGFDGLKKNETLDVSYLSLAVANKFVFNKVNFQLGTTFDVKINDAKKYIGDSNYRDNSFSSIDLGFFAGIGFDITKNFGIEGRVKKGIIPVSDWDDSYTNVVFQVGAAYTFDLK
ncbi:porin family protein [Flavobacterium sp. PL002]|uniref:porin family protein n=1 Tax=Flavobacterium sp. PL002 TaxID=1897058 RepID=UPI001788815E|nr:porin family protein [Flavobacterium sp. PL002]MBE0390716.1 hypothetical protein [Flavobacterium sp. PL002]